MRVSHMIEYIISREYRHCVIKNQNPGMFDEHLQLLDHTYYWLTIRYRWYRQHSTLLQLQPFNVGMKCQ